MPRRLSLKVIQRRIDVLQKRAAKLQVRDRKATLRKIIGLMRTNAILMSEISGAGKIKGLRKGHRVKPKYRNPKTGETWSGRGRAARWLVTAEKAGRKRTDFLIKKG